MVSSNGRATTSCATDWRLLGKAESTLHTLQFSSKEMNHVVVEITASSGIDSSKILRAAAGLQYNLCWTLPLSSGSSPMNHVPIKADARINMKKTESGESMSGGGMGGEVSVDFFSAIQDYFEELFELLDDDSAIADAVANFACCQLTLKFCKA